EHHANRDRQFRGGVRREQPRRASVGTAAQPGRTSRARGPGGPRCLWHRGAPSSGVLECGAVGHSGSRRPTYAPHSSAQRRPGPSIEAFPLFGDRLEDYDALFAEKLDLLLKIRDNEHVNWSGRFRPAFTGQGVYPRPVQNPLPIWLGAGGTPQSFARAGALGLPLMVAIIGGEPRRFRPLIDLYRETGQRYGHPPDRLKVGVHALGYVAKTTQEAADEFFPGYARAFTDVGKERGWPPVTRAGFDAQRGPHGALLIGSPEEVAEKIVRHSEALGGISRLTFQMNAASLPHAKLMRAIEAIGTRVAPAVKGELAAAS